MTRWLLNKRAWVLVMAAGAMPLGTVADCGYTPGLGGTFFYDAGGHDYYDGPVRHGGVVIVDDWGYDDYFYDDIYYEEVYYEEVYYEEEYCDPWDFGCWW